MNKFLISIAAFAVLLTTPPVFSKELVSEFKGSESRVTAEFEVKAPWIIDWRTNGDYPGSMGIQVSLLSSPGDEYLGKVVSTKYVDNGVKLFEEGGRYRLQVNSSLMNWTLRVEQLTHAEAEAYSPK
jgi:hypothetical protein